MVHSERSGYVVTWQKLGTERGLWAAPKNGLKSKQNPQLAKCPRSLSGDQVLFRPQRESQIP